MKEIKITVAPGSNFTPSGLMHRYARETSGVTFGRSYFGESELTISGKVYRYHHWSITAEDGTEVVTLSLQEKSV